MPRGGYHLHAERWGRKSAWKNDSVTKTIRVPLALADQVLDLAHQLDNGEFIAFDTKSIQALKDEISLLSSERDKLVELNHALKSELDQTQPQQQHALEAVRDRIMKGLRVGKQATEYKRIKAALDKFIAELIR